MNASVPAKQATARWPGFALDGLCLLVLLTAVCFLFLGSIQHPQRVPDGMDLTQHYSREAVIRWALRTTWIPLWNPFEFSGFPLQADLQTGVLYPPSMLLRVLPLSSFLTWTVILHVWLFGAGGYALCRTSGSRRDASLVASIGLMLGGIAIPRVYAGHLDVLRTLAWLPLALALAIRSIDRRTLLPGAAAVAVLTLTLISGFLQLFCYTVFAIVVYAAFAILWPAAGVRSRTGATRVAAQVSLLILLAAGLSAYQMLPTIRLVLAAGRTSGVPLRSAIESSVPLRELPAAVWPPARADIEHQSWETSAYVGWLPTILAPLAFVDPKRRRMAAFFAGLAAIAAALATGGPLYTLHHMLFPMFRVPGRLMVLWAIPIAVLGAAGFDWLRDRIVRIVGRGPSTTARVVVAIMFLAGGGVTTRDVLGYARPFAGTRPIDEKFAPSVAFAPSRFGRVLSLCENRLGTGELTGLTIPSADGYNSYFLSGYAALAEQARGEPVAPQRTAFHRLGELGTIADFSVLNLLDVTEIVSCAPLDAPGLELVSHWDDLFLYRNHHAAGRVAPLCSGAEGHSPVDVPGCADGVQTEVLAADRPNGQFRARISVPASRVMFLSEPYYPERRAWVDGVETPIEHVSVALSGVKVGAGTHVIELRFVPTTLYAGAVISALVAALWAAAHRRLGARPDSSGA